MHLETPELQFAHLFQFLQTPTGIVALLIFGLMPIFVLWFKGSKWWLLALLLFFAPLMPIATEGFHQSLVTPFHQMQVNGRPICGALLLLLLIPSVCDRGWRTRLVSATVISYFVFELIFSIRFALGGTALRGIVGSLLFLLIFIALGIGVPRWLQDMYSVRALLRSVAVAGLLFVIGTVIQLLVNRGAMIIQDRLFALTANPQQAGLVLAVTLPPVAFLAAWKGELKILRILWAVLAAFMVLLLLWTGSRTGAVVAIAGLALLFRRHMGRMLLLSLICGALVLVGMQMWFAVGESTSRLISGLDTRTNVWIDLIKDFSYNPLIGVGEQSGMGSENSYLSVAARVGLMGLIPLAVMIALIICDMVRLHRARHVLQEQAMLVDLVIAGVGALLFGAILEGFLIGTLEHQVFMLYLYLALGGFLLDAADFRAQESHNEDSINVPIQPAGVQWAAGMWSD